MIILFLKKSNEIIVKNIIPRFTTQNPCTQQTFKFQQTDCHPTAFGELVSVLRLVKLQNPR